MQSKTIRLITSLAVVLALCVVMLGAYTRLTNAGLGCPDWPGCYGQMVLPAKGEAFRAAQQQFPQIPIESTKAWTEMAHRYAAGTLGILIILIAVLTWRQKQPVWALPVALLALLVFQALLGMWTVTLKLLPVVVMGHLLGGILIFSCLARLRLQQSSLQPSGLVSGRGWVGLGLLIVFVQIALGGWVSSNYAGIACIGFPQCNGQWLPDWHLREAFNVFSPIGDNYQGGLLDHSIRVTIQTVHRIGAVVTVGYLLVLCSFLMRSVQSVAVRCLAAIILALVAIQFTLGLLNVIYLLPLSIAVAHNGVAALLMASLFMLHYLTRGVDSNAK